MQLVSLSADLLEVLRCPACKGPLSADRTLLACPACRAGYGWSTALGCWDLRPSAAPVSTDPGPRRLPGAVDSQTASRRGARLWRALRASHSDLPRQGVALRIGGPSAAEPSDAADSFRHDLWLVTAAGHAAGAGSARRARAPTALVDPELLPIASQSIDLVDAAVLDVQPELLTSRLAEVHRVLAPSGHAYLTGRSRGCALEGADVAARSSFGDGYAWIPAAVGALPGAAAVATVHRHLQSWVGFEYTLGRGIQARRPGWSRGWLVRIRRERELVCWRTRSAVADWKSTPSDEAMVFGRFHFPGPTSAT